MNSLDYCFNQIVDELHSGGITGWCPVEKALDLAATVMALRPKVVLETGIWGGRSFLPMALALEAVGSGIAIGIDPWSASASVEGYSGKNADWWAVQPHEQVYQNFLSHVHRLGLKDRVRIQRVKSDDAEVPPVLDLAHLDSQHSDQTIREINRFAVNVRLGGICVLDDLEWRNNDDMPVLRAVDALLALGFVELYRRNQDNGNWGFFQRVSLPPPAVVKVSTRESQPQAVAAPKRKARVC